MTGLDYHRLSHRSPEPPLKGLDAAVNRCIGGFKRRGAVFRELWNQAQDVDALAGEYADLTDHDLQQRLLGFRSHTRREGRPGTVLVPALAAIREAGRRQVGLRAFVVQIMGALALEKGFLAEMATGEGKTLTAGLAGVLAGWTHRPCHLVTVNDYLVKRDSTWLQPLYRFCGVRVGCVTGDMDADLRRKGYAADITYTTSKELLADFLRDQIRLQSVPHPTRRLIRQLLSPQAFARDGLVQRGIHTAIVDEADSVLIDEAVTPLIISSTRPNPMLHEAASTAHALAAELNCEEHYRRVLRYKEVELTDLGLAKIEERCSSLPGIWRGQDRRAELIRQALVAREYFVRDKQYIVVDGKVVIVDEFTGRPMPQRTWREGLHQAIEAKEGVKFSDPTETVARMSFQRFFRCFHRLSGMTGTAFEAANEFWQIYSLPVIRIPPNKPCVRVELPDRWFLSAESKWLAVVEEVERLHREGRPVLVGTRNVANSEQIARMLKEKRIDCQVLNAHRLEAEAQIVTLAGEPGRITIATNMAGRGTDIRLGDGVAENGGLRVIATERHESGRVDRQLFGRSGRQGDPGTAQAFLSVEDELFRRHLPDSLQRALHASVRSTVLLSPTARRAFLKWSQRKSERLAWKQRLAVLRADEWLTESLSFAGQ